MGSAPGIPDRTGGSEPARPVPGPGTYERVGDFVQKHLLDLFRGRSRDEDPGERDGARAVVALAKAGPRVVEAQRPVVWEGVQGK